ncbi:Diaminopimelate epimerase-like protein [Gymnopus androsaceus JB14]|uniref:trans-L-3-hydroxyproline dehydratase n=1 Tax=Gymnopus androsaceus JB14 TaxID=1447944 RepID=A0A6A4I6X8_9AGAR|nr:Diaminopimelate epimerase-like protein [Gymnopus androsaceus JB14]
MDIFKAIGDSKGPSTIRTVEMHTSGEPTRIIISGFPTLEGETLLGKRRYASERHEIDRIRKWLMREPRGHEGMYGGILVQETELTRSGEADIGVLFCHNEGYSTMCGHATIALGRFLVDSQDTEVFPRRKALQLQTNNDRETFTVLRLHAPCGVVNVYVPTTLEGTSDITKPVRFRSVPSFVSSPEHGISLDVPSDIAWPKLIERTAHNKAPLTISMEVAYGGAFYALVNSAELGFTGLRGSDLDYKELAEAARIIRILLNNNPQARQSFRHPHEPDLGFLYGVTVVDSAMPSIGLSQDEKSETGICFFADEQIDRSPTGSCVSARVPLAVDRGRLSYGGVVVQFPGNAFRGRAVERMEKGYIVEIEGFAYYTGAATFTPPQKGIDAMGEGFELKLPV